MALSGSTVVRATTQNNLIFYWEAVQSIADNRSTINWQLQLEAKQGGEIVAGPGSPWSATVAGQAFSGATSLAIGNNETKVLASGSVTVVHANDGTGSFFYSFSQEFWIDFDGEYISVVSGSGSAVLDTIARASQPSLSADTVTMGEKLTIYTNGIQNAGLRYRLRYAFGNVSGTIAEDVHESYDWYPDISLAKQIPNNYIGYGTIYCDTFAGNTLIGTLTTPMYLLVPDDIVPTVTATWEDTSGAYEALGAYVQNISRLAVTVSGTGIYGSTITGASVMLGGKAYSGAYLTDSGDFSLEVTVTDSRGRSGSASYPITVAPYSVPSLNLSASRYTEDGAADDTGEYGIITVTGYITPVNGQNNGQLKLTYGDQSETVSLEAGDVFYRTAPFFANINETMAITAELSDMMVSAGRTMVLSTGYATLDLLAGGKGLSLGKAATIEGFDCAMKAFFRGGLFEIHGDGTVDSRSLFDRVAALEAKL